MSSSEIKTKSPGSWLPGVIISVLVVIALYFLVDWKEFNEAFKAIRPWVVVVTIFLTLIPLMTRSLAWRSLLNQEISLRDAFFGENIGYMANNFFPLRLGEIARAVLIGDKVEGGFAAVLPSIFLERLIDLGFAALTLLLAIPFVVSETWMLPTVFVSLSIVVFGIVFLYLSFRKAEWLETLFTKLFSRFPKMQEAILRLFHQFIEGLKSAAQGNNAIRAVFFLGLTWAFYWITYYVLILSIVPNAPFIWALFTDGVVSMGIAIPSAPGSLGVWEASFVAALAVFGIEQSKSLAIALVSHIVSYAITGIFGIIGFSVFGSSLGSLIRRVRQQRQKSTETIPGE